MLFVIHALDRQDVLDRRKEHFSAHKEHLAKASQWKVGIVMSGPLMADDGQKPIGSLFVLEAPDRATVEAFHHGDPLYKADIWDTITITAFEKRHG